MENIRGEENTGRLVCRVFCHSTRQPVYGASVIIKEPHTNHMLKELITNAYGKTEEIELASPPVEYSWDIEQLNKPYSVFNIKARADGLEAAVIEGVQIFPGVTALQDIFLPLSTVIKPHPLFHTYPPKRPEEITKHIPKETGFIGLDLPLIPEYIVVHDAAPHTEAQNYWLTFRDYIKNVVSGRVYPTWPEAAIKAVVLATISFALNRVFTTWYRRDAHNFTITSSTIYDQNFNWGRTIYREIEQITDNIYNKYITMPGERQPLLSQYCDGNKVQCGSWLESWRAKQMADSGHTYLEILKDAYGQNINITTAAKIIGLSQDKTTGTLPPFHPLTF